jgi:ferredoxin
VCVPECPVDAIYAEADVPADQQHFVALNAELSLLWPVLTKKVPAPADAGEWAGITAKLHLLDRG